MKIEKIYEITFDTDDTIITATLSAADEWVMLLSSGIVVRYKIDAPTGNYLFSTKDSFEYPDGGFDINSPCTIYTMGPAVVLTNDFKCHAFLHYTDRHDRVHLQRKDYHSDVSPYPIALFKDAAGVPHLAYGVAWNHVQIMSLDTLQVLTAAKSLIEVSAEERHIEHYEKYSQRPGMPWPTEYDYFFGSLMVSPDDKKFMSAGWVWGSMDCYTIYDIADFISNPRIAYQNVGLWEHSNRATCWIDNNTVAIVYSPYEEGDEEATAETWPEIHFFSHSGKQLAPGNKISVSGLDNVKADMSYNKHLNALILQSDMLGTLVISLDGITLFKDANLHPGKYHPQTSLFIKAESKTITLYSITEA